ncbi:MAG: hypothetical protein M3Y21_03800 [Candidatus Eremiobacteraeota bacterium]|nr:hypothetical protein [Candidatus Eremiobacteraeota bacterium]
MHSTIVLDRCELSPGIILLGLHAPQLARVTFPGHFLMAIPPSGERAATALGIYEAHGDRVSILFVECGSRTRELAELHVGGRLDVIAPLGNGFDLSGDSRDVAIVAGGVGIASLLLPALALLARDARVRLYYGARTQALLVECDRFADSGCEVWCATDDGSRGHHGYVTDLLAQTTELPDLILGCGPTPMLRTLAEVAAQRHVPAQLSLEETFACGVGGCWGCVVPLDRRSAQAPKFPDAPPAEADFVYARICKEGPVFLAHELRW